ncbi:hypothetical protein HMI54_001596 [Coelomomyces lativittatus]|nr:hypothetical protein HMI54_001596 [Coelomomyces lativittatus]KAJ1514764.1 hypothetical protein HMI56_007485 [Coelomomyces lativittatus]KAJ1517004.1 hypothetical protein HMI55_000870 [Coelomomyces lativittatus]
MPNPDSPTSDNVLSKPTAVEETDAPTVPSDDADILHSGLFNIEASAAFKFLDQLKAKEAIPEQRIEYLTNKHYTLYQYILTAFEYEKAMLKKTKALQADVTRQKLEMDKSGTKVYDDNAIIGELRRELLRVQNEVSLAQARDSKFMKELDECLLQKETLIEDIEEIRKHKTHMLEPQILSATKEIKLEIMQKRHQLETLENDLEEKDAAYEHATKEREKLITEREGLEKQLVGINEMPSKLLAQSEILRDGINSLVIENVKQVQFSAHLDKDLEKLAKRRKDLEDEKLYLINQLDRHREAMTDREKKIEEITTSLQTSKLDYEKYQGLKSEMQVKLKDMGAEIKSLHEAVLHCNKDKEQLIKAFRKLEGVTNNVTSSLPQAKQLHHDLQLHLNVLERDRHHYQTTIRNLRNDIDVLLYQYIESEKLLHGEKEKYQSSLEKNHHLELELEKLSQQATDLQRTIVTQSYEREMRAREYLRMESKLRKLKEDSHQREMEMHDAVKKASDAQTSLTDFAQKYESVKHDRNRYVNLISSCHQRTMEMKEKTRILRSEIEILRSELAHKDRELTKKKQDSNAAYSKRDNAKMETNRLLVHYREKRSNMDQQTGRIDTLSNSLSVISNELHNLKAKYEQFIAQRNAAGLLYLERSDELCMLYEKSNIQESAMKKGEAELTELEENIEELTLIKKELERSIRVKKQWVPKVHALEKEYTVLMEQYKATKSEVLTLSTALETPTPDRLRQLGGTDPTEDELDAKIEALEEKLASQEEKLVEKKLMFEEIDQLTFRLQKQTLARREDAKTTLTQLNRLTRQLHAVNKEIMASIAEISMSKTLSHALETQIQEKQAYLQQLTNQSVLPDFDKEWMRKEKRKQLLKQERETKESSALVGDWTLLSEGPTPKYLLPKGIKTTAIPRPNAYIPNDELPVAKPYGQYAPFKPGDINPGSLKYLKKPEVKPIEF